MSMRRAGWRNKARQPTANKIPKTATTNVIRRILNTGYGEHAANHQSGSMMGWNPMASSPTSDIDAHLYDLHSRARDLQMGNAVANSAINTSRTNIIGAGLKARPRIAREILGMTANQATDWERKTAKEFELWADSKNCDLYRQNNFYDIQDINFIGYMTNGDAFALLKYRQATTLNPYHLRIQLIEADRINNPDSSAFIQPSYSVVTRNPNNGNRIVSGVEIDSDGAVIAYWICNRYLYDMTNTIDTPKWVRVLAKNEETDIANVLQTAHIERPEQYRGIPFLAPVMATLKQVSRYTDAELTTAIIRSFLSLFFTQEQGSNDMGFPLGNTYGDDGEKEGIDLDLNRFKLGAGTLNKLPPGYDVKTVSSTDNMDSYEVFTNTLLKQVGAALEIPYEVLMKHFQASYSAARAALLQAWSAFSMRREWYTRDFCQPIYEAWLAEAVFLGRVEAPGFFDDPLKRKAYCKALWYGPVIGVLDPVKEAQGAEKRINLMLSTREKESLEMTGTQYEDNMEELAREKALAEHYGLTIPNGKGGKQQ